MQQWGGSFENHTRLRRVGILMQPVIWLFEQLVFDLCIIAVRRTALSNLLNFVLGSFHAFELVSWLNSTQLAARFFNRGDDRLALILRLGPCYGPWPFEPSHFTTTDAVQGHVMHSSKQSLAGQGKAIESVVIPRLRHQGSKQLLHPFPPKFCMTISHNLCSRARQLRLFGLICSQGRMEFCTLSWK